MSRVAALFICLLAGVPTKRGMLEKESVDVGDTNVDTISVGAAMTDFPAIYKVLVLLGV